LSQVNDKSLSHNVVSNTPCPLSEIRTHTVLAINVLPTERCDLQRVTR